MPTTARGGGGSGDNGSAVVGCTGNSVEGDQGRVKALGSERVGDSPIAKASPSRQERAAELAARHRWNAVSYGMILDRRVKLPIGL